MHVYLLSDQGNFLKLSMIRSSRSGFHWHRMLYQDQRNAESLSSIYVKNFLKIFLADSLSLVFPQSYQNFSKKCQITNAKEVKNITPVKQYNTISINVCLSIQSINLLKLSFSCLIIVDNLQKYLLLDAEKIAQEHIDKVEVGNHQLRD